MAKQKTCLLVIDPQIDFMEGGNLAVGGATADMQRLAKMVKSNIEDIDDIHITLDSHYYWHIAHPNWWMDKRGNSPKPFETVINVEDVENGTWRPRNPADKDWALHYVRTLRANKRFALVIWNPHCIIGTPGQAMQPDFLAAVSEWENRFFGMAPRTTKGSNPFTEHYSAVKADVEFPGDPGTRLNTRFIDTLRNYDRIYAAGEALSHCLNFTMSDVVADFSPEEMKKIYLLEDATSSVGTFEKQGEDFVNRMVALGMNVTTTDKAFK